MAMKLSWVCVASHWMPIFTNRSLPVFLGIGILRLGKRMTTISETGTWSPVYMKNKFILYAVSFLFTGMNILMMVMTALPKDPDTIPRFYWPVTVAACIAAGSIYWGGLKGLQMKFGGQESIGKWIGFEVQVYNEGDENIPEMMRNVMVDANLDGSRRRVSYKVSYFHRTRLSPVPKILIIPTRSRVLQSAS